MLAHLKMCIFYLLLLLLFYLLPSTDWQQKQLLDNHLTLPPLCRSATSVPLPPVTNSLENWSTQVWSSPPFYPENFAWAHFFLPISQFTTFLESNTHIQRVWFQRKYRVQIQCCSLWHFFIVVANFRDIFFYNIWDLSPIFEQKIVMHWIESFLVAQWHIMLRRHFKCFLSLNTL